MVIIFHLPISISKCIVIVIHKYRGFQIPAFIAILYFALHDDTFGQ